MCTYIQQRSRGGGRGVEVRGSGALLKHVDLCGQLACKKATWVCSCKVETMEVDLSVPLHV